MFDFQQRGDKLGTTGLTEVRARSKDRHSRHMWLLASTGELSAFGRRREGHAFTGSPAGVSPHCSARSTPPHMVAMRDLRPARRTVPPNAAGFLASCVQQRRVLTPLPWCSSATPLYVFQPDLPRSTSLAVETKVDDSAGIPPKVRCVRDHPHHFGRSISTSST